MALSIFVSYRRDDSGGFAALIGERLRREFGKDLVFVDVDSIDLGANFANVIRDRMAKCDVLLAFVGPNWLNAFDEKKKIRRLKDPNDFVRIEIAAALKRGIPAIPVLLGNATMPKPDELPRQIRKLVANQGYAVRQESSQRDIDFLIEKLKGSDSGAVIRWAKHHYDEYLPVGLVEIGDLMTILEPAITLADGTVVIKGRATRKPN